MHPDDRVIPMPQRHRPARPLPAPAPPSAPGAPSASVAAYRDGFEFGVRHAWFTARTWWACSGFAFGVAAGAGLVLLLAHFGVGLSL